MLLPVALLAAGVAWASPDAKNCKPVPPPAAAPDAPPPYTIGSDARVELLSLIQALATDPSEGHPYAAEAAKLPKLASHAAVKDFKELAAKGVPPRTLLETVLYASEPPELALPGPLELPSVAPEPVGGRPRLEAILADMRDFAKAAKLDAWLKARKPALEQEVAAARAEIQGGIPPATMAAFLGRAFPIPHAVFVAPGYRDPQSEESILWTSQKVTTVRFKSQGSYHLGQMGMSLSHELAHDVTQPWAEKYAAELDKAAGPLPLGCQMLGPQSWASCFDEHVVRSVETKLMTAAGAKAPAPVDPNLPQYPYETALVDRLGEYEAKRSCYPTLADFYPRLVDAVKEQAASAKKAK